MRGVGIKRVVNATTFYHTLFILIYKTNVETSIYNNIWLKKIKNEKNKKIFLIIKDGR